MTVRDFAIPDWLAALTMLAWAAAIIAYARGGDRELDRYAWARAVPRVYLAVYYLVNWIWGKAVIPADLAHVMSRWGYVLIAGLDMYWIARELWALRRRVLRS